MFTYPSRDVVAKTHLFTDDRYSAAPTDRQSEPAALAGVKAEKIRLSRGRASIF